MLISDSNEWCVRETRREELNQTNEIEIFFRRLNLFHRIKESSVLLGLSETTTQQHQYGAVYNITLSQESHFGIIKKSEKFPWFIN